MKRIEKSLLTIGYSSHRIESLPFAKKLMDKHDVIILEESPHPKFTPMLNQKISIDEYLSEVDSGFPVFSRRMYKLICELHLKGKTILQIEPYMEKLIHIHTMFFEGKEPSDVLKISGMKEVYEAEKKATRDLLHFYESSMSSSFSKVIEAVKNFACADADRFRLRDTMRAEAIAKALPEVEYNMVYVEAGAIHTYLEKILQNKLKGKWKIKSELLSESALRKLTGKKQIIAPGDILTEHYILRRKKYEKFETLQAARALIYIQLLEKEEMVPTRTEKTPHIKDETKAIALAQKLTLTQCEELYNKLRFKNRSQALQIIQEYLNNFPSL